MYKVLNQIINDLIKFIIFSNFVITKENAFFMWKEKEKKNALKFYSFINMDFKWQSNNPLVHRPFYSSLVSHMFCFVL